MDKKITLDTILPRDTEVVFEWRYKSQVKEDDFWGWNSGYGFKGMSVEDVIKERVKRGFRGDYDQCEFRAIRFFGYKEYESLVRATSGD